MDVLDPIEIETGDKLTTVNMPAVEIILDSFVDYICVHESTLLREAIQRGKNETTFSCCFQDSLINVLIVAVTGRKRTLFRFYLAYFN